MIAGGGGCEKNFGNVHISEVLLVIYILIDWLGNVNDMFTFEVIVYDLFINRVGFWRDR